MKTLVIGAGGFVGPYLIKHLVEIGWEVEATYLPNEEVVVSVPMHKMDILSQSEIQGVLKNVQPDCIVHLAAQSSVALSWKEPSLTVDVNVKGTINVLEAIRKSSKSARILLIGSGDQYGFIPQEKMPICEYEIQKPESIYAVTKCAQDMLGSVYSKAHNMDIVRVRAFNHIGPGQSPHFVVSDFCRQVALLEKSDGPYIIKVGNLDVKRDFSDVRDIVRAYILLLEKGISGEVYNVGSGSAISIKKVLDAILCHTSKTIKVVVDTERFRPADSKSIEADISKLRKDTGWLPQIEFDETIQDTLEYWRKNC